MQSPHLPACPSFLKSSERHPCLTQTVLSHEHHLPVPIQKSRSDVLRPLDPTETFWNSFHEVGRVMILSVISVVSSHPISLEQLKEASTLLAFRHQALRSCIVRCPKNSTVSNKSYRNRKSKNNCSGQWYWANMHPVNVDCTEARLGSVFGSCESSLSTLCWLEAMAREQEYGFDLCNGPLWRIRLIPSAPCFSSDPPHQVLVTDISPTTPSRPCNNNHYYRTYILACFHHAIMDGVSRQRFWNELCCSLSMICLKQARLPSRASTSHLTTMDKVAKNFVMMPKSRLPDAVQSAMPPTLLLSVLDRLFPTCGMFSFVVNAQRRLFGPLRNPFSFFFPHRFRDKCVTLHTSIIPIWIPTDVTAKLQSLSKSKGITLNGVVTAVAALAMARLIWQRKRLKAKLKSYDDVVSGKAKTYPLPFPLQDPSSIDVLEGVASTSSNSPLFISLNSKDKDVFTLPLHTPAHLTRIHYKPWLNTLFGPSRDSSAVNLTMSFPSSLSPRVSLGKTSPGMRAKVSDGLSERAWRLPLHMYTMQAISCRRWLPCYNNQADKQGFEQFIKYLETFFNAEILRDGDSEGSTQASVKCPSRCDDLSVADTEHRSTDWEGVGGPTDAISTEKSYNSGREERESVISTPPLSVRLGPKLHPTDSPDGVAESLECHNSRLRLTAQVIETATGENRESKEELQLLDDVVQVAEEEKTLLPGLGSYATLMPQSLWVGRQCEVDKDFWGFARRTSKNVHSCVDRKTPTKATLNWQIISGFITAASTKKAVLKRLASPLPRPSSFMMSNGGLWNTEPISCFVKALNDALACRTHTDENAKNDQPGAAKHPPTETEVAELFCLDVESSWSCVAQHAAGINMFCHNIVTLGGRMCWSLQYHTNLTNRELATEYGKQVLYVINQLIKQEPH